MLTWLGVACNGDVYRACRAYQAGHDLAIGRRCCTMTSWPGWHDSNRTPKRLHRCLAMDGSCLVWADATVSFHSCCHCMNGTDADGAALEAMLSMSVWTRNTAQCTCTTRTRRVTARVRRGS